MDEWNVHITTHELQISLRALGHRGGRVHCMGFQLRRVAEIADQFLRLLHPLGFFGGERTVSMAFLPPREVPIHRVRQRLTGQNQLVRIGTSLDQDVENGVRIVQRESVGKRRFRVVELSLCPDVGLRPVFEQDRNDCDQVRLHLSVLQIVEVQLLDVETNTDGVRAIRLFRMSE